MGSIRLTPRSRAKRDQIQTAARRLFLERGFAGTTVDAISQEAGVSKATVYGHYPGKEELLVGVLEELIGEGPTGWPPSGQTPIGGQEELREALFVVARSMVSTLMRPENLALMRIIIAETPRFPQLGELFRRAVPARGIEGVSQVLVRANEGGAAEVAEADLDMAARMFGGTLLTYVMIDGLLVGDGPRLPPGDERVERAVEMYMKAVV